MCWKVQPNEELTRNFSIFVHRILNSTNPSLPLPSFFMEYVKENCNMLLTE